jgi:hypothetical protein
MSAPPGIAMSARDESNQYVHMGVWIASVGAHCAHKVAHTPAASACPTHPPTKTTNCINVYVSTYNMGARGHFRGVVNVLIACTTVQVLREICISLRDALN